MFRRGNHLYPLLLVALIGSCRKEERSSETNRLQQGVDLHYRVDQPDVIHHEHEYPNITFQQYDEITVRAGGCVTIHNDAGASQVDFLNSHANGGHGLIWIAGATAGLEPIASVVARSPIIIRATPPGAGVNPQQIQLVLGYDKFDISNDYAPAPTVDCNPQVPAWVEFDVTHHNVPPDLPCPYPSNPRSLVDIYWTGVDPNMLPLNPMWGAQCPYNPRFATVENRAPCDYFRSDTPPCSTHVLKINQHPYIWDLACAPMPGGNVHGHVNWGWATFTNGTIYYDNYSGDDDDINAIYYSDNRSVFASAPHTLDYSIFGLDLEFKHGEVTDQMRSGFWNNFRLANESGRHQMMDGKPAQIVGLLNADVVHNAKAELHPIIGLAMQIRSDAALNTWAVFARPWGNEGGCSRLIEDSGINNFAPGDMRFMLPVSFTPAAVTTRYFSEAYVDTSFPGGVLLTLRFPGPLNYGEIDISPTCIQHCPPGSCGDPEPYGCGTCWTCNGTCCNTTCYVPSCSGICCGDQCQPTCTVP